MGYRKLALLLAVTALSWLMFAGCQGVKQDDQSSGALDLSRLEIPSTYYYQMEDTSTVYGKMAQSLERVKEDGDELVKATFSIFDGVTGESTILFDPEDGTPVRMVSQQEYRGTNLTNTSVYEDEQVTRVLNAPTHGIQDTAYTAVEGKTYDWMQSSFLIQALDLSTLVNDTLHLQFYQGFGAAFIQPADIFVVGAEQVEVPAGTFDTWHVHIDFAGSKADLYIEQGGKRRLIKHDVPGRMGLMSTVLIPEPELPDEG